MKGTLIIQTLLAGVLLSGGVYSEETEQFKPVKEWACTDFGDRGGQTILTLQIGEKEYEDGNMKYNFARIQFGDDETIISTHFKKGLIRIWYFISSYDNESDYKIFLKPDGTANYYDFSGGKTEAKPSALFSCKQTI